MVVTTATTLHHTPQHAPQHSTALPLTQHGKPAVEGASAASTPALSRTVTEAVPSPAYLGAMLGHLARVGDELSQLERGPGEGLNYFAILEQHPSTLLPQLMLQEVRRPSSVDRRLLTVVCACHDGCITTGLQ